jgi:hypothetical protein
MSVPAPMKQILRQRAAALRRAWAAAAASILLSAIALAEPVVRWDFGTAEPR